MANTRYPAYELRTAGPEDEKSIEAVDSSFTTGTVFRVEATDAGFTLTEVPVDPPLTKVFPEEEPGEGEGDDDGDTAVFVALDPEEGRVAGFISLTYAAWNRRVTVEDIEVAPEHRGRGVGRALLDRAVEFGREREAGHLWLEVSSVNAPAIRAYRRMGFAFCGLDTSLYLGTGSEGEQALFMSRPCP
ncbi:GNAT family N-acetyltransferase [Streptomyces sp. HNM0574]|uniref:GNAT family N-acetyltransferase n=1 Tax=Streptomyces sp. HNM0574 TaxID=2714954 RepID=UPI00146CB61A|nr:GNAT family N-acetyltransferase [Streptomyces sp. HNM0574]NLU69474.1 GNAT family N-acetyltransferase [Streptomyces sp. HNM0574]